MKNLSDIHAELYRNLSIIANDKEKMQKLLDFSHQLADPTERPSCDENTVLDDSDIPNDDKFNIFIDIEGTDISDQEIIIDPYQSIRKLRDEIVKAFNQPRYDNGENPLQYLLGLAIQEEEPMILDFEDEDGREQCILDYDVMPGDRFILLSVPIAGGGREKMETRYLPKKKNLFQRIFGRKSNLSYASAFLPDTVSRGNSMMIQVYLYSDGDRDRVCADATQCDHLSSEKAFTPLEAKLKKGDQIDILLRIGGLHIERSTKTIIWQGDYYRRVCFHAEISENWKDDRLYGEIFISVNNTIIGELDFITDVTSENVEVERTANVISRQYKKIFISYAHQDEDKVKYIAEGYRAQGIDYFFDRHYLKGGDIFPLVIQEYIKDADMFFLCWSENAANSDYVQKELAQALQLAFPNVQPYEKATLTIYPVSIEPHALLPEDMRDYYNFIEI